MPEASNFTDPMFRIHYMLGILIRQKNFVPATTFMDEMFISRTTISNDLRRLKILLNSYNLSLESKPGSGIRIVGSEQEKRRCIIHENIPQGILEEKGNTNNFDKIKELTLGILIAAHFEVSDIVFQNLVLHIDLAVQRMQLGFSVEDAPLKMTPELHHAYEVSDKIMHAICDEFLLDYNPAEAVYLTIDLQGKREFDSPSYINKEINDFVVQALQEIKDAYHIDLIQDTRLRIALSLHTIPLLTRVKEHAQIDNVMKYSIKQNYPFAYDLATNYAYQLQKKYDVHLIDDEISYLAVHFSLSLESAPDKRGKRILLISSQKPSDMILVQQKIYQWFKDQILSFDTIDTLKINTIDVHQYDAIFTTEKELSEKYNVMVLIPFFLTNKDYPRIELAINGLSNVDSILNKFSPELFFQLDLTDKTEIIKYLCQKAEAHHPSSEALLDSVMLHERIVNTSFGNQVAMPHPESPVSNETFIAVGLLKEPTAWSEKDSVQLVLLVSIERNNPRAYQLWYYLSYMISNKEAIQRIIQTPTFENFSDVIRSIYTQF